MKRVGSFRARLAVSFLALLAAVQIAVLLAVHVASTRSAHDHIEGQLLVAGRVFDRFIQTRGRQLTDAARLLASEFELKTAMVTNDHATLLSVMQNHQARMNADVVMLASLDHRVLADTGHSVPRAAPFPFPDLIDRAQDTGEALGFVAIDGRLYQAVVVPVLAPVPVAWVLTGFHIDDAFAKDLQTLTSSDLSFVRRVNGDGVVTASTLPAGLRTDLARALLQGRWAPTAASSVDLAGNEYVTLVLSVGPSPERRVLAVLQRPLKEAMRPFRYLQEILFALFVAGLIISVIAGIRIARSVSQPLLVLADGARKLEQGDYGHRVELAQRDEFGRLATAFNSMARGISEREERLKYQAYHDGLTGLPNRALFHHLLQQAVLTARRERRQLAVLLLDLDRFKEVNDTLGHNIGDLILQEVGPRLHGVVRESDTIARLGGDECAVLLQAIPNPGDATDVVQRIRKALEQPFFVQGQSIELSASVGIAFYPDHGEDATTLIRRADVAMYVAKRAATGVAVYAAEMDPNDPRRLTLVGELRHAIEQDRLMLHYQPKVDLASGRVTDVEALLRWPHAQHGLMPPSEFIPLAEQTGLIGPLTLWVLNAALRQWTEWRAEGLELGVAVNLSPRVLQDEELPDRVRELLEQWRVPPATLVLEITESAIVADPGCAKGVVTRLDELGVRLSVDDFGTGYSSLAYLKDLPIDELKIDKSFVMDLREKGSNEVIVRATIDLAHNLDIKVTAEGVETHDICDALAWHGCDHAQGYLISRPVPAAELTRWLRLSPWRPSPRALAEVKNALV